MKISFVIPCYCSTNTLPAVIDEIKDTMAKLTKYTYEIVLVNDCSPDDTFDTITKLAKENDNITGLSLAKNFGQHSAIMAGLNVVSGDIIVCLDDDGQTPANEVSKLLDGIENGADVVYAKYTHKKHNIFRNFGSMINERMTRIMLGKPKNLYVSSYFAARRFVVDEMIKYTYAFPYLIGLVLRTTKNVINVEVNHRNREIGQSGYTFGKLMSLWFNGFTAFSVKPLRIATFTGSVAAVVGFLYGIYTIIKKLFLDIDGQVAGFAALMSVIVFMSGLILLMMGLIGEYIGRTYISMNNSPQYVVARRTDEEDTI
ncbi:MAG: glycosyltransferase family 2 protein [Lachnospiraceae bacterium]|nr:glycosyltransferase family 2 protein [Lachnospiraceae bacterium]